MNMKSKNRFFEKIFLTFKSRKILAVGIVFGFLILGGSCRILKEAKISGTPGNQPYKEKIHSQKDKTSQSENESADAQCVSTYNVISGVEKCGFSSQKCLETVYIYCHPSKKLKEKKTRWVDNPWYGQGP